jgi:hypothetical protein
MIQITIDENEPIGQFILAKARESGRNLDEVAREITQEEFEVTVRSLHEQFGLFLENGPKHTFGRTAREISACYQKL